MPPSPVHRWCGPSARGARALDGCWRSRRTANTYLKPLCGQIHFRCRAAGFAVALQHGDWKLCGLVVLFLFQDAKWGCASCLRECENARMQECENARMREFENARMREYIRVMILSQYLLLLGAVIWNDISAGRYYQPLAGHAVTGSHFQRIKKMDTSECGERRGNGTGGHPGPGCRLSTPLSADNQGNCPGECKESNGSTSQQNLFWCCVGAGGGGVSLERACTGVASARGWRSKPPRRATWPLWWIWTYARGWPPPGAPPGHRRRRYVGLSASLLP